MKNCPKTSLRSSQKAGMTLVEMMAAMTISALVLGFSINFLVEATRTTLKVQSNTQNDLTDWGIYAGITIDTRTANGMTIYKDFNSSSFNDPNDRITDSSSITRGNFLVLTQSTQEPGAKVPSYISMTGYVYAAGATAGTGTFKRFTYTVPTAEKAHSLETILTDHYASFDFKTIAKGLDATHSDNDATTPTNRAFLFRSVKLRSGVLNLEVSTGYATARTANKKLIETAFFIRN